MPYLPREVSHKLFRIYKYAQTENPTTMHFRAIKFWAIGQKGEGKWEQLVCLGL